MLAIGSDHAGYELKEKVKKYLTELGVEYNDYGTHSLDSVDYPDYAHLVSDAIQTGVCERGILICGTGVGISISANKHEGIRAVVCSEPLSAQMSRAHNDSNVLCFGARVIGEEMAKLIVKTWLDTPFEGGRHQIRVEKIESVAKKMATLKKMSKIYNKDK